MVSKSEMRSDIESAIRGSAVVNGVGAFALKTFGLKPSARGYQVLFRSDEHNHCPGCGHSQWFVGRATAECAFCGTALPLDNAVQAGLDPIGHKPVALHVIKGGSPTARHVERRRAERHPADGRVLTLHIDDSPRAFAIQNISSGGVMGEDLAGIGDANALVVELEDGTLLPAELRWCSQGHVGLAFIGAADTEE
jgi:hypothetical protein